MREINKQNLSKTKIKGSDPKTNRKCQKAEKKGFIMKKFNGCVVKDGVIALTKAFAKQAYTPGTAEFRHLAELHKAFPEFPIVQRTATKNENKEKHDGLTIKWMTDYIKNYKDEVAVAEFDEVKKFYKTMPGYYGKVKGWFLNKYPNYQEVDFADVATSQKPEEKAPATPELAIA